jgi:hypothetical protein
MLSRETDTELCPAKLLISLDSEHQNRIRPFQLFFPLHPPAISNRQRRDSRLTLLLHRIMLPSNIYSTLSSQVTRYRPRESFSPSYGSVPILLHHKLDSGQRRDPSWLQSATRHPLVLDVFVYFSENLIASTRPTHPSPSKLIYSSLLWREVTGFDLGEEMKFEYSCVWTHYNRNQG